MKTYSTDILLMVMKSAILAWHLGQHVNLNTTHDFPVHLVFPLLALIEFFVVNPILSDLAILCRLGL